MTQNLPANVLVIDDDSTVGQSVEGPLAAYKIKLTNCQDLQTALFQFNNLDFDVALIELEYEPLHGLALIQKMRDHDSAIKRSMGFIIMSGKTRKLSDDNLMKELMDLDVIIKPFSVVHILPFLSRAFAYKKKQLKFEMFKDSLYNKVKAGQKAQAIEEAKKAVGSFGARGIALTADLYVRSGDLEGGLAFITPIAERDPANMVYQYERGRILRLMGRMEESKVHLEKAHESSPLHIRRLEDMGDLYLGLNDPQKAVASMKTRLALNPEQQDIKFDMFKKLVDRGHDEWAQRFCRETTNPKEVVRYYNNKGVELSKNGDTLGAIKEYEQAIKLYPNSKDNFRLYYNIALAYTKMKTPEYYQRALDCLEKCLKLSPGFDKAINTIESIKKITQKKAG